MNAADDAIASAADTTKRLRSNAKPECDQGALTCHSIPQDRKLEVFGDDLKPDLAVSAIMHDRSFVCSDHESDACKTMCLLCVS